MPLRFPDQPLSVAEWRRRWKGVGGFREEPGEPAHTRVWWGDPRFCVTIHHSAYGHGAGGMSTRVTIERVTFEERLGRAGPRSVTWREGDLDALDLGWLPAEVRSRLETLFAAPSPDVAPSPDAASPTAGRSPRARVTSGWTALHAACDAGHVERLGALLAEGAIDPSARSVQTRDSKSARRVRHDAGGTPLHVAVWLASPTSLEMVGALLRAGADPNVTNDAGASSADLLGASMGHAGALVQAALVPVLAAAGARLEGAALGAERHRNGVVLLALAKSGFDFDRPLGGGPSLRARLAQVVELQWKKKRTVLNAAGAAHASEKV
jgi:hypothetical protein